MNKDENTARKIDNEEYQNEEEVEGEAVVNDDESAAIAMANLTDIETDIQAIEKRAQAEIEYLLKKVDAVKGWADSNNEKLAERRRYYLIPLEYYMRGINAGNSKKKHIDFASGRIGIRKQRDRVEIIDGKAPADFVGSPYVKEKVSYTFDKRAILNDAQMTGEVPEFAEFIPGSDEFYYKPEIIIPGKKE